MLFVWHYRRVSICISTILQRVDRLKAKFLNIRRDTWKYEVNCRNWQAGSYRHLFNQINENRTVHAMNNEADILISRWPSNYTVHRIVKSARALIVLWLISLSKTDRFYLRSLQLRNSENSIEAHLRYVSFIKSFYSRYRKPIEISSGLE